jgi:alanine racemase
MSRAACARISSAALEHNLNRARHAAPASRILAVIKANGYGHGIVRVARALASADAFAVASIDEAVILREAGINQPIVLLEGVFNASEVEEAAARHLELVVHAEEQLQVLEAARLPAPFPIWLKIDTGMHRLGFAPAQAADARQRLEACPAAGQLRLMSHLANADRPGDARTDAQLDLFDACAEGFSGERSMANSGAVLAWQRSHFDWVRPGIMLYGASPFGDTGAEQDLRPAMTLGTRLIAVNRRRRGDAVGYGGTWTCPEDMLVGVAAIGYGDGYPRHAPNGTPVLVNGRRVPLIGRVSMDMICLDLRSQPEARPGDPVVLWGDGLPVEEVARAAETISYELLCRVTERVRFEEV